MKDKLVKYGKKRYYKLLTNRLGVFSFSVLLTLSFSIPLSILTTQKIDQDRIVEKEKELHLQEEIIEDKEFNILDIN